MIWISEFQLYTWVPFEILGRKICRVKKHIHPLKNFPHGGFSTNRWVTNVWFEFVSNLGHWHRDFHLSVLQRASQLLPCSRGISLRISSGIRISLYPSMSLVRSLCFVRNLVVDSPRMALWNGRHLRWFFLFGSVFARRCFRIDFC